jgi:hypothetical protein
MGYFGAIFLLLTVVAQPDYSLKELRRLFFESEKSEKAGDLFYDRMEQYKGQDAVLIAYKGAAEAIQAKYAFNPIGKLNHLKSAHRYFSKAVQLNATNPEIRFIRYSVESNTPKMLDKSDHLAEDKSLLIDHIKRYPKSDLDAETYTIARNFLLADDDVTTSEKQILEATKP